MCEVRILQSPKMGDGRSTLSAIPSGYQLMAGISVSVLHLLNAWTVNIRYSVSVLHQPNACTVKDRH